MVALVRLGLLGAAFAKALKAPDLEVYTFGRSEAFDASAGLEDAAGALSTGFAAAFFEADEIFVAFAFFADAGIRRFTPLDSFAESPCAFGEFELALPIFAIATILSADDGDRTATFFRPELSPAGMADVPDAFDVAEGAVLADPTDAVATLLAAPPELFLALFIAATFRNDLNAATRDVLVFDACFEALAAILAFLPAPISLRDLPVQPCLKALPDDFTPCFKPLPAPSTLPTAEPIFNPTLVVAVSTARPAFLALLVM